MNSLNSNIPIILFCWLILVLLLFNLYRYIKIMSRKSFLLAFAGSFILLFFALFLKIKKNAEQPYAGRVAIFPFSEKRTDTPQLTARGFALADFVRTFFNHSNDENHFAVPLEWIIRGGKADSLTSVDYCRNRAQLLRAVILVIGLIRQTADGQVAEIQIFEPAQKTPRLVQRFPFTNQDFAAVASEIADALGSQFQIKSVPATKPALHSMDFYEVGLHWWMGDSAAAQAVRSTFAGTAADRLELEARRTLQSERLTRLPRESRIKMLEKLQNRLLQFSQDDSANIEINLLTARCLLWREEFDLADVYLKRIIRQQPRRSEAYQLLSQLHFSRYRQSGFANETELLQKAVQLNPADILLVCRLAGVLMQSDQIERAVNLLENYRRRLPDNFMLLKALGQAYIKQGKTLEIFEIYNKILEIDPQNTEAFYNLGIHYYYSGEQATAKRFFHNALRDAGQIDSYLYLAHIAGKEDSIEQAIFYLQQRLKMRRTGDDPYAEEARRRLFELNIKTGKIDSSGRVLPPMD